MAKKKTQKPRRSEPADEPSSPGGGRFHAFRETVESVVIAFVLAFLFRTFEAEAFVIPTGSMSPSLQGQHKDHDCPQCGHRFRASASEEGDTLAEYMSELRHTNDPGRRQALRNAINALPVVAGMCPMCRYTAPMQKLDDIPTHVHGEVDSEYAESTPTYPGDRILVNKYGFSFQEPERWDVVVFKFPGDGNMNYIKRLVGLPNEQLQIFQGDLFMRPEGSNDDYQIIKKPPAKVRAMLQEVHDTDFDPANLYRAGWPLRWAASDASWKVAINDDDRNLQQRWSIDADDVDEDEQDAEFSWLRYRHLVPRERDWQKVSLIAENDAGADAPGQGWLNEAEPELITDFNPYNARINRGQLMGGGPWEVLRKNQGMHWVGDLAVECDVEVQAAQGELALDLVEAGKHFRCVIQLDNGEANLQVVDGKTSKVTDLRQTASTGVIGPGKYRLLFANVDDQLLLWVDDELAQFPTSAYDPDALFGAREKMLPWTSDGGDGVEDRGDLAPAGVGARNAKFAVTRLAVCRDIYYIATSIGDSTNQTETSGMQRSEYFTDYLLLRAQKRLDDGTMLRPIDDPEELFIDPELWPRFRTRRKSRFSTSDDQFFVLGDNSPESQDCRLWNRTNKKGAKPGGPYLDRQLLIGEAVCVFWPHSWGNWLGLPVLNKLPGFPAFRDMRLVR